MARTEPFHAADQPTYHDNTECLLGDSLPAEERRAGDGGKAHCRLCEALNRAEESRPRLTAPPRDLP